MPFCRSTPHKKILPIRHVMGRSPLRVGTDTVPSARPTRGTAGWKHAAGNFCPPAMPTWCLRSRTS
jgi:hypothetical protein